MLKKSFKYNKDFGVVICTLETEEGKTFYGKAKCRATDTFNKAHGEELSYQRALAKLKKYDIKLFDADLKRCDIYIRHLSKTHSKIFENLVNANVELNKIKEKIKQLKQ